MPRYTVDLADEVLKDLDEFAERNHISRKEALQRALSLISIANSESAAGNKLGIISDNKDGQAPQVVGRIAGI